MRQQFKSFSMAIMLVAAVGCAPAVEQSSTPTDLARQAVQNPLPPEKAQELLKDAGHNWLYGNGVGETAIAVGSIVAFPPMVIYWLGNAAMGAAGYEPIGVSTVLPEEERAQWRDFYDGVTAAPGRVNAAVAGEEFVTRERAKERLEKYMPKAQQIEVEQGAAKP